MILQPQSARLILADQATQAESIRATWSLRDAQGVDLSAKVRDGEGDLVASSFILESLERDANGVDLSERVFDEEGDALNSPLILEALDRDANGVDLSERVYDEDGDAIHSALWLAMFN